jgi:hypothetical protein
VIVHFLLALIEFFLINWLGRHSISSGYYWLTTLQDVEQSPLFNATFRILAPTIYLVITAAFWYAIGLDEIVRDYWRVTVFYFVIRTAYQLAAGRRRIVRWGYQAVVAVIATSFSVVIYQRLLTNRSALLPSGRGLTDQLWIVVIGFVYLALRSIAWPTLGKSNDEKRDDYLHAEYNSLRKQFGATVTEAATSRPAEVIAYSIMIYESFNRPPIYQWLERHLLFQGGFAHTLGPMQVTTSLALPNEGLVRLGVERVNAILEQALEAVKRKSPEIFIGGKKPTPTEQKLGASASGEVYLTRFAEIHRVYQSTIVREAASLYNVRSDYPDKIASIFRFLRDNYYKDIRGPGSDEGLI